MNESMKERIKQDPNIYRIYKAGLELNRKLEGVNNPPNIYDYALTLTKVVLMQYLKEPVETVSNLLSEGTEQETTIKVFDRDNYAVFEEIFQRTGLNQKEFAKITGLPESIVSNFRNRKRKPSIDKLVTLCRLFRFGVR